MSESVSPVQPSRRSFLDLLIAGGTLAWLGSVLYPLISYFKPLPQAGPTGPVGLSPDEISKIEREKFAIIPVGGRRLLIVEDAAGELHALEAKCTHEGCTVRYVPGEALIWCACHNGRFDLQGRVLAGPPPRPLARHTVRRDATGRIVVAVATA